MVEELVAMDVRARFARLRKPIARQREAAVAGLRACVPVAVRLCWQRFERRWLVPLFEFEPPRGAGASAAALLILAATGYGAVMGDHGATIKANLQGAADAVANSVGFRLSEVAIAGAHQLSREEILRRAGITGRSSLLFLDATRTRDRLLTDPWIAQATVLKLYPGRLRIGIKERKPYALWQLDGRVSVIADDGTVLETFVPERFAKLPLVVGVGAAHEAHEFLTLLAHYRDVATRVSAAVLVADRRWNLHLKGGIEVLLSEETPERALRTLVDLDRDKKLLSRDITVVDLRLADRVSVRLSDAAAAARQEALKAAEKNKKKRKGGEA
jgi:cell division protein FtsQ